MARPRTRKPKQEEIKKEPEIKEQEIVQEEETKVEEQPKEEVKEVEQEEEQVEEAQKSKPKVDASQLDVNTEKYVNEVINKSKTLDELLEGLGKSPLTKSVANRLKLYKDAMDPSRVVNPKEGAGKNYDLYTLLISIIKNSDQRAFNIGFKVINKVFILGKNDVFNPINLSRFDYEWRWGEKTKSQYEKLIELIATLANPANRKLIGKTISLETAIEGLSDIAKENLTRFYTNR
jgi:hypothetical protein